MRQGYQPTPEVEALMDRRDDLMVQISLEADARRPDPERLLSLQRQLIRVENDLSDHQRAAF